MRSENPDLPWKVFVTVRRALCLETRGKVACVVDDLDLVLLYLFGTPVDLATGTDVEHLDL